MKTSNTEMKSSISKTAQQTLAGIVQMARLRVATAENRWKAAKERARVAKRRRKEVKLIARRARKQAKQAKADLAEARNVLAKAEAKLARSAARSAARKPASAGERPVARRAVAAPTKKAAPTRKGQPAPSAPSRAPGSAVQVTPASLQESDSLPVPDQAGSVIGKPDGGTPEPAVIPGAAAAAAAQDDINPGIQPRS
jgi:hypothetical protein